MMWWQVMGKWYLADVLETYDSAVRSNAYSL
jgi:hypothetical protein